MTAARATAPENPQPTGPAAPREPDRSWVRLAPGTHVTMEIVGLVRAGVVQLYEPENTRGHHTFPVLFPYSGQWRLLSAGDVTVVVPPDGER